MGTMRGRLAAWWIIAAFAVALLIALGGGQPMPVTAAPPSPAPIPSVTGKPSAPPPAPSRSGIGPAAVLILYANKTTDDTGADPGDCTTPGNTDCSLRAALGLANLNAGSTINVAAGTFTLTHADGTDAASGLVASAAVTIAGAGAGSTFIEANAAPNTATYRVLRITGANVTVQGVTIRNGVINVPTGGVGGGGVRVDAAGALIEDSTISGNTASGTDMQVAGGGLSVLGGDATLLRDTVSGNTVNGTAATIRTLAYGGGAAAIRPLTVRESTFANNMAQGTASGGTLFIAGGGIFNQSILTVTNSTFTGNTAIGGNGGAINNNNIATVTSSTLTNNTAPGGGGVSNQATATLTNVIVAASTGGDLATFGGSLTGDNNLIDDSTINQFSSGSNNISKPALLGTLGTYGGTTQTFPLLPGSPAIDAGAAVGSGPTGPPANTVPATDQRGKNRAGTAPDIGAFESQGFTMMKTGGDGQSVPATGTFAALAVSLTATNAGDPVANGQVTFTVVPNGGAQATFGALAGCTVSGGTTAVCTITGTTATSPALTAGATPGSFTVTAAATGAATQTFNLTIQPVSTVVNSVADGTANIANCAAGNAHTCRLRDAIAAVNAGAASGTSITFDATVFPPAGPQKVIVLGAATGTLTLNANVTITGPGAAAVAVDGGCTTDGSGNCTAGGATVFTVNSGVTASLTALTIQHGNAASYGGGITNQGALTLSDSTLTRNHASSIGGGIYTTGTLVVARSTFLNNIARGSSPQGGALANVALLANATAMATVTDSTFTGNDGGTLGGALENATISAGQTATLTVTNSTIAGNTATGGGGIANVATAGATTTVMLTNTLVAGNTGGDLARFGPATYAGSFDLIGDGSGGYVNGVNGNKAGTVAAPLNALLGPLGTYGSANGTQTLPLLPGSPAIDGGTTGGSVPTTDQRGKSRVGTPDIGAFESQGFSLAAVAGSTPQSTVVNTAFANPLAVTVAPNTPGEPVQGGGVTFAVIPVGGAGATLAGSPATIDATGRASVTATANGVKGAYTVTASATGSVPATFSLLNTAPLVSISVTPATATVKVGQMQTFTATGTFADNSTLDLSAQVTWSSDAGAVATVDTTGKATGQTPGTAHIKATQGAVSGQGTLTVTPPTGTGITINPSPASRPSGTTSGSGSPNPAPNPAPSGSSGGTMPVGPAPAPVPTGR